MSKKPAKETFIPPTTKGAASGRPFTTHMLCEAMRKHDPDYAYVGEIKKGKKKAAALAKDLAMTGKVTIHTEPPSKATLRNLKKGLPAGTKIEFEKPVTILLHSQKLVKGKDGKRRAVNKLTPLNATTTKKIAKKSSKAAYLSARSVAEANDVVNAREDAIKARSAKSVATKAKKKAAKGKPTK